MWKICIILFFVNCEIVHIMSRNLINEKTIQNEIPIKMTTDGPETTTKTSALSQTTSGPKSTTLNPMDLELAKIFDINLDSKPKSTTSSPYDKQFDELDYDEKQNVTLGRRTNFIVRKNCNCYVNGRCSKNNSCADGD